MRRAHRDYELTLPRGTGSRIPFCREKRARPIEENNDDFAGGSDGCAYVVTRASPPPLLPDPGGVDIISLCEP